MSIASEITRINTNIASAYSGIAAKDAVLPQSRNSENLRTAIDSIPYYPKARMKKVNFLDYEGNILYSYDSAPQTLPTAPSFPGLTAQGWNMTSAQIATYLSKYGRCDVSAIYVTYDGKTRLYISIPNDSLLTPTLYLQIADGSLTIDWGDGSTAVQLTESGSSYVNKSQGHSYAAPGDYVISLSYTGSAGYKLGQGSGVTVFGTVSSSVTSMMPYINTITRVEIGRNCDLCEYALSSSYSLKTVTIPKKGSEDSSGVELIPQFAFSNCGCLRHIAIPSTVGSIERSAFLSCSNLSFICLPASVSAVNNTAFQYCRSLSMLMLPCSSDYTTIIQSALSYCLSLKTIKIPNNVTAINSGSFANCYNLRELDLTDYSDTGSIPTLSNVNAFSNTDLAVIRVKNNAMKAAFASAANWSSFSSLFTV